MTGILLAIVSIEERKLSMAAMEIQAEDIAAQLCGFLRERILAPGVPVTPDTDLSDIGVDSFALMELILFVERRYGLVLPPEALTPENLASVAALSRYCAARLPAADG